MKTIIAGSRDITDKSHLLDALKACPWEITEIVAGGARGVDTMGAEYAYKNKMPLTHFKANWKQYGRSAGPRRNRQMAEYADALLAIWDGRSRGTAHMMDVAAELGLQYHIHRVYRSDEQRTAIAK